MYYDEFSEFTPKQMNKLLNRVQEHNQECDSECKARAKYCVDYLAVGRRCALIVLSIIKLI